MSLYCTSICMHSRQAKEARTRRVVIIHKRASIFDHRGFLPTAVCTQYWQVSGAEGGGKKKRKEWSQPGLNFQRMYLYIWSECFVEGSWRIRKG